MAWRGLSPIPRTCEYNKVGFPEPRRYLLSWPQLINHLIKVHRTEPAYVTDTWETLISGQALEALHVQRVSETTPFPSQSPQVGCTPGCSPLLFLCTLLSSQVHTEGGCFTKDTRKDWLFYSTYSKQFIALTFFFFENKIICLISHTRNSAT